MASIESTSTSTVTAGTETAAGPEPAVAERASVAEPSDAATSPGDGVDAHEDSRISTKETGGGRKGVAEGATKGKQLEDEASGNARAHKVSDVVGAVATGVEVATLAFEAGVVGVAATAVGGPLSLGAAHNDAHVYNRTHGVVDGYAVGYASGLYGEPAGARSLVVKPSDDPKRQTYLMAFNDGERKGHGKASIKSDEQRAAERSYLEGKMERDGEGHMRGDVLVAGRYVKREILK